MSRRYLTFAAGAFYVCAGALHFLRPGAYVKIMPPYVPYPLAMVYISGVAEIAGGLGLFIARFRRPAALGLILLLLAVLPANVYMATNNIQVTATPIPIWALYARLPLQFALVWWLWFISKRCNPPARLSGLHSTS